MTKNTQTVSITEKELIEMFELKGKISTVNWIGAKGNRKIVIRLNKD